MSMVSNVGCLPWMVLWFGRVPLFGVALNVAAVPLVSFVALPAGLLAMCAGWPLVYALRLAATVMGWVEGSAAVASRALGSWAGLGLGLSWPPGLLAGLAVGAVAAWSGRRRGALLAVGAGALVAGLVTPGGPPEVRLLPVGQGDAILVRDGAGRSLLVDAGGSATGDFDPGERVVRPALRRLGVRRLDVVLVSHGDVDHIGGLPVVIREFAPREVWWSGPRGGGAAERRVLEAAREVGAVVREPPARAALGGVALRRLDPVDRYGFGRWMERNERSAVYEATMPGGARVLLTGDVERLGEWRLLGALRPVHVLKAAHHGSRTSSTAAMLRRAAAPLVVIQAGRGNRFGHPHPDVVRRYEAMGSRVISTVACGEVVLGFRRAGGVEVRTGRRCVW